MELEHYLAAVSAAIEDHEARMSEAYEYYANALRNSASPDPAIKDALDALFLSKLGTSYLAMTERIFNLRKWPRT